jgi:hypothetical protein
MPLPRPDLHLHDGCHFNLRQRINEADFID